GTTGLVNFAHAEMITWGMFIVFLVEGFAEGIGLLPDQKLLTIALGALAALVVGGATGWLMNRFVFAPLRRKGTPLISQMVVTIGFGILARYVILYFFGGSSRFFKSVSGQSAISIGVVDITPSDLIAVILSIVVLVIVGLLLQRTRIGRAMRAVSDNRDLAESSGIDVQRVISQVWSAGGALAALGGLFLAQADQVLWEGGFRVLLLIFAGVTLGGLGTAYGALVGCLLIGLGVQLSTLFIPIELKNVGALLVMAVVLLIRPQGILGRKERIG
ncbi:MAG: branched-chain amino acid ABC transporter permease, partial [Acidimicrobiia bacterium]|nr:branched-chain amino acid ABC transporter permease [Acidimicrobiia bacterium]